MKASCPALAITCGLPRSGKSTLAGEMQLSGWTVVCPDEVRLALHGQAFVPNAEGFVWATTELMVRALLRTGNAVLVDATNTTVKRRAVWLRIAKEFGLQLDALVVDTSLEECHRRNKESLPPLPSDVIDRMAAQWEYPEEEGIRAVVVHDG